MFGWTADETNSLAVAPAESAKDLPVDRSQFEVQIDRRRRAQGRFESSASDLVVTGISSQVMPLKAGSPQVTLAPVVPVGSPPTSVPVFVSLKIE